MRITIIGENDTARALRALLRKARFAVGDSRAAEAGAQARAPLGGAGYSISIEESAATGWIHLDSVASELEAAVFHHVAELSPHPVSVDRPGGQVHHERELRIVVPADDPAQAQAVEYGVLRGLLELIGPDDADDPDAQSPKAPGPPRRAGADGSALPGEPRVDAAQPQAAQRGLWKRIIGVLPLLLLCAATLLAAPRTPPRGAIVITATDDAGGVTTLRLPPNLFAQLQQPGSGSNLNLSQIGGASVSGSLYDSGNTALKVNCVAGCSATGAFTDNAAFTTGSTAVTNISGLFNDSAAALTSGSAGALRATSDRMLYVNIGKIAGTAPSLTGSSLNVNCTGGCGGAASFADNSAFTAGTTGITNTGGVFNDGLSAVSSGNAAAFRITSGRALHVNLRNSSGTEIGTSGNPVRVDPVGTTTQPVSGTVTANIGTTSGLALDTSVNGLLLSPGSTTSGQKGPLVQCAVTASAPSYTAAQTDPLSCNTSGGLRVDGSGVTQPVSGTVTSNAGTGNFNVNIAQVNGSTVSTAATGVQKIGVVGSTGAAVDGAPGSGAPANVVAVGASDGTNSRRVLSDTAGRIFALPYGDTTTASYSASATVASAASATDIAVLPGNATNTVLVYRVRVTCTQTTAGIITLNLIKRSSADTSGTSSNMTVVPDDSNFSAGVSVPKTYTANPTTGTAVGNVDTVALGCMATGTASPNDIYILNRAAKPIVLRGTAQQLAVNLGGATVSGGSFQVTFEYAETTTP